MDKNKIGIALLIAAGVGYYLYSKITSKIVLKGIRAARGPISLTQAIVKLYFRFENQNNLALPFDGLVGGIFYGGKKLADVNIWEKQMLPAKAEKEIPADITIKYAQAGAAIMELIRNQSFLNELYFEGSIKAEGVTWPKFKQKIF